MEPPQPPDGEEQAPQQHPLGRVGPPVEGRQRRSAALAVTLVSLVLAFLALAAFAGALEAWTTNRMEATRAGEPCQPAAAQGDGGCITAPVTPHVVRGVLLGATVVALQVGASRTFGSDQRRPGT